MYLNQELKCLIFGKIKIVRINEMISFVKSIKTRPETKKTINTTHSNQNKKLTFEIIITHQFIGFQNLVK